MIDVTRVGSVAVLRLEHGKVNALDLELLNALSAELRQARDSEASAVVLTGQGRTFCAGVDLRRYLDGGAAYSDQLVPALSATFEALFSLTIPTVAAVNGAAIAGGCILAAACDFRLLLEGAVIGATELAVGVPFPAAALEILRYACGRRADEVILGAELYSGERAIATGLAHEIAGPDALLTRAVSVAERLATNPAPWNLAKQQLHRPVYERIAAEAPKTDALVAEIWASPSTASAVRASLDAMSRDRPR